MVLYMNLVLLPARLLLAAVFIIAGISKLADLKGSRKAVVDFGFPPFLANPIGILLPLAELATGGLLLPAGSAWWGGLSALVLLMVFIIVISINLALGRNPDCHCFGQVHSKPVAWATVLRNAILAAMAAVIIWKGHDIPALSLVDWLTALSATQVVGSVMLAAVFTEGWLLFNLIRQNGRLLLRLEALEIRLNTGRVFDSASGERQQGLAPGSPAPFFQLPTLSSKKMSLGDLCAKGKSVLLVFSDPNCGPCNAMLPDLSRWQHEQANKLTVALVSRGTVEANRAKTDEHGLKNVLLQTDREVAEEYHCFGTPGAVLIKPDGSVGSYLATGAESIGDLVSNATGAAKLPIIAAGNGHHNHRPVPAPPGPKPGEVAPSFELPDLSGKVVRLSEFKGRDTLVLFWNPGCGFCNQILADLKNWEDKRPNGSPELLLVSTGAVETNRAIGIKSTVVLDQGFSVGASFGANGTPSAVLVNAEGRIASSLAIGGPNVLALAGAEQRERALSVS